MRLVQTLRHLAPRQAVYLAYYRLLRPAAPARVTQWQTRTWLASWQAPRWRVPARQADGSFRFLGQTARVDSADDWDSPRLGRLWRYNLHYLDDLDAVQADTCADTRVQLLDRWIDENPPPHGTGWEPYPLSLRIVNTIKFIRRNGDERPHWMRSLVSQASALAVRIEHHIRANHLFENGKALVFAGSFFGGAQADAWLNSGLRLLDAECREQFLPDGAHFELSPMYHATMLWNLCELVHLAEVSGIRELRDRASLWRDLIRRGLRWYAAMTHPDGGLAFFNDAAFGVAPDLATIEAHAATLDVETPRRAAEAVLPRLLRLDDSGYLRIDLGAGSAAILDVANIGPDYQPGHAHADTLSFELSLFGRRVLVNSGTSTYERGEERDAERGTAAHNTVIVDERNSSDTWAGFRVGRRARPTLLAAEAGSERMLIRASHDGYRRFLGGATHLRQWSWTASGVCVIDQLEGRFGSAAALYHFHPDVRLNVLPGDAARLRLALPGGRSASVHVPRGRPSIGSGFWHPEFGRSVPNQQLRVDFVERAIEVRFEWQDAE